MSKKIKIYRMPISRVFPATHPKKGEETYFYYKIKNATEDRIGFCCYDYRGDEIFVSQKKIHTIRQDYQLWKKRIDEVNAGNAVLVIYEWKGKPYRSKTNEIFRFDKDGGIGVQKLIFQQSSLNFPRVIRDDNAVVALNPTVLSKNDGISLQDFKDWFKGYDLSEPMAIIHFTKFRY